MLALVWAARHFRPYLYGRQFLARTDHNSLRWLHNFKEPEGQVARWLEILSEFDYRVEHRPGVQHANADSLSRRECRQCGEPADPCVEGNTMITVSSTALLPTWSMEEIRELQMKEEELSQFIKWLQCKSIPRKFPTSATPKLQTLWNQRRHLTLVDGVLYRRWEDVQGGGVHKRLQLVLPASLVPEVMTGLHNSPTGGHMGVKKTLEKIRARFYWPRQRKDVEQWCSRCQLCTSRKSPIKACAPMQLVSDMSRPLQRIAMDIVGPFPETRRGNRYILVIGDYFTKWKEAFPIKDMEAATVARYLVNEVICRLGVPDTIHTDQGKNFDSKLIKEVCQLLGVTKTRTTPYHPQSDGLVERFNRTLLNMLSIAVEEDELSWDLHLPTLLLAYRTSIHETTGVTPFELMFGREPRVPVDVMFPSPDHSVIGSSSSPKKYADVLRASLSKSYERVRLYSKKKQQHQKQFYDRGARGSPYQVGDIVSLHDPVVKKGHSRKFHRPWKGPFKVVKLLGSTTYRIQDCKNSGKRKVVHFNRLKPAYCQPTPESTRFLRLQKQILVKG